MLPGHVCIFAKDGLVFEWNRDLEDIKHQGKRLGGGAYARDFMHQSQMLDQNGKLVPLYVLRKEDHYLHESCSAQELLARIDVNVHQLNELHQGADCLGDCGTLLKAPIELT